MQKTCKKLLIKRFLCTPEYDNKCPQQNKTEKMIKCHSISFLTLRANILQQSWNSGLNQSCFLAFFLLSLSLISFSSFSLCIFCNFPAFLIFEKLLSNFVSSCENRYAKICKENPMQINKGEHRSTW